MAQVHASVEQRNKAIDQEGFDKALVAWLDRDRDGLVSKLNAARPQIARQRLPSQCPANCAAAHSSEL